MDANYFQLNQKQHKNNQISHHHEPIILQPNQQQNSDDPYFCQLINFNTQTQQILLSSLRFYKKSEWAKDIIETFIDTDFQSTTIELHYGPFATKINIINFNHHHQFLIDPTFVGSGQYGKVNAIKFNEEMCVVKMIKFDPLNVFVSMKNVYRQYFIALMASELRVGPKIVDLFGYSIVFLNNFALFGMELCRKIDSKKQQIKLNSFSGILSQYLNTLHSLHVVHRDIKPENIMWSPNYQKYVFIDFGLSIIIKQKPGEKTYTEFAGSYTYCSPEMKKYFLLKHPGKVELYQNDQFGLQECQRLFLSSLIKISVFSTLENENREQNLFLKSLTKISNIKIVIYFSQFKLSYQLLEKCHHLPKSCLFIVEKTLQKSQLPQQEKDLWQKFKVKLQQNIINCKLATTIEDQIIYISLQKVNMKNLWSSLLFSQKHLFKFKHLCENQMWLQRIYLTINPIANSEISKKELQFHSTSTINAIYAALNLPPTNIFIKKARAVILFFFQKFRLTRKVKILQSLSDISILIMDQLSAMRIRHFILEITEDPVQYCLQCFKYQIINKQKYNFRAFSNDYVQKIKKKFQNTANTAKNYHIVKLIHDSAIFLSNFLFQCKSREILGMFYKNLDQLKKQNQILNIPQFRQIISQIEENLCYLTKVLHFWDFSYEIIQQQALQLFAIANSKEIHVIGEEKKRFYRLEKIVNPNIINKQFYSNILNEVIQPYATDISISKNKEIIDFFYEMCQGRVSMIDQKIFVYFQLIVEKNKFFALVIIKEQIKWIEKQIQSKKYMNFDHYYWIIMRNIDIFLTIWKSSQLFSCFNKQDQKKYFQLLDLFYEKAEERVQKAKRMNQIEKNYLHEIIKIGKFAKKGFIITQNPQNKDQRASFIKVFQIQAHKRIQFSQNQGLFLQVFAQFIKKIYYIQSPYKLKNLEQIFIKVFDSQQDIALLITTPDTDQL